ncbi:MAG: hypothetical protein WA862_08375 [Solirubrobacterales bacterium]
MEASGEQQPGDDALDFGFAPGWPDEVVAEVRRFFSFDLDEVRGRSRLGALAFEDAPGTIEEVRGVVRDLALEPWDEIPQPGDLQGQLTALNGVLDEMQQLSADHENAGAEKQRLDDRLRELRTWFRDVARPWARRALIDRRLAERPTGAPETGQVADMHDAFESLRQEAADLRRELEARRDLVGEFRDAARESAGQELAGVFLARAKDCRGAASGWLKALVVASLVSIAGAIVTFDAVRPEKGANDPHDLAALGLGLFILGILAFGVRICAQNYRVNRHLEAIARSKAAAISTFQRLVSSVEDADVKSAVTLTLAQAVFTPEETGLVDGSGDHVTLVERAVLPTVARTTGGTTP